MLINNLSNKMLTVYEFADLIRVNPQTVRRAIISGHISAFRVGTGSRSPYRIPSSEVERMALFNLEQILEKK